MSNGLEALASLIAAVLLVTTGGALIPRAVILLCAGILLAGCSSRQGDSMTLQERAKAFLERPTPEGMPYAPDSISERFIAEFAQEGELRVEDESLELLELCVMESENAASGATGDERQYFEESAAILRAILDQSKHKAPKGPGPAG